MKLSKGKSKVLRFDIKPVSPTDELSVDIANEVEANDYLNPGNITLVSIWKVNATNKKTGDEVIGYLNQSTTTIIDQTLDQYDLFLLKRFVEASFLHAQRLFHQGFVYQNSLPVPEFQPIAVALLASIANLLP